jgi:hypothetical protein
MTAKLGGLWDSMLAEGKGWWITTNSDIHRNPDDEVDLGGGELRWCGRPPEGVGQLGEDVRVPRGHGVLRHFGCSRYIRAATGATHTRVAYETGARTTEMRTQAQCQPLKGRVVIRPGKPGGDHGIAFS